MSALSPAWSGRVDGNDPAQLRWHQVLAGQAADPGTVIVGFASDAGVARNLGRIGAAQAPDALRAALASSAWNEAAGQIVDLGDVEVQGDALEAGQAALGQTIATPLREGRFVVVLGGGHETAFGSYLGLRDALLGDAGAEDDAAAEGDAAASGRAPGSGRKPRLGILNLDAHFDLRSAPRPSSGTPFLQIAGDAHQRGEDFAYLVVGISEPGNTRELFETARRLGVGYVLDEDAQAEHVEAVRERVRAFVASVDVLYLTIDLDVLPAAVAPGVSAPAGYGVPMHVVRAAAIEAAASGKLALLDVVELNPRFDVDGRTAKAGARLIHDVVTRRVPRG